MLAHGAVTAEEAAFMRRITGNFAPILLLVAGCAMSTEPGADDGEGDDDGDIVVNPGDEECVGPLGPPRDPQSLPVCCQDFLGNGHCLEAAAVDPLFQAYVDPCPDGGFCIPDKFLATGGVYTPPPCSSLDGAPGVCLSVCIPAVGGLYAVLPQDICDEDERCAPCISPIDGSNTGACDIVGECVDPSAPDDPVPPPPDDGDDPTTCVHEGDPVIDPSALTPCAIDAHCLPNALVPPELASQLAPCADGASKCVPDVFLVTGGAFIPPSCRSMLDAEGRCLSRMLPAVSAQEAFLPQSTCSPAERCVPCYSPIDGTDTMACRLSCDPGPTEPPVSLPSCCDGRARCVPNAAIPEPLQETLEEDDCEDIQEDAFLCVPNELLDPTHVPPACSADGFLIGPYTGVCLSDCLSFGLQGLFLSEGTCADGYECVPCQNPLSGEPTGAPGCT